MKVLEIVELVTKPETGVLAGVSFGDTWQDVQAHHDPRLKVVEWKNSGSAYRTHHLISDYSNDDGLNEVRIDLGVDGADKVISIQVEISGHDDNAVIVRQAFDELEKVLAKRLGAPECVGGVCKFRLPDRKNSICPQYIPSANPVGSHITIQVLEV